MNKAQQRGDRRGEGRRDRGDCRGQAPGEEKNQYPERVVAINRAVKVVQGGRRFSSTALTVVDDGEGAVSVGYSKVKEVSAAITKGMEEVKKHFFRVPLIQRIIPHLVQGEKVVGVVLLCSVPPGTGVIAGGPACAVLECAGVHGVLAKSLGLASAISVVRAMVDALQQLEEPEAVVKRHGLPVENITPAALLHAHREEAAG